MEKLTSGKVVLSMMKNKIKIVNWLLTRKCNLKCDYCGIIRNNSVYKNISYYNKHEMHPDYIINALSNFKNLNDDCFHIFYGGEPFLYPHIDTIIKYCNDNNILYTIITNNTLEIQPIIEKVIKKVGYLIGLSSSIDPIVMTENELLKQTDRYIKSIQGLAQLKKMSKFSDDIVAEITIDNSNIDNVYNLIEHLTEYNICSSITCIDLKNNDYYDFSNVIDKSELLYKTQKVYQLFDKLKNSNLLIHMKDDVLMKLYENLPINYDCKIEKYIHNITVDADGKLRLCLRIRGTSVSKINIIDLFDDNKFDEIHKAMILDKNNYCIGCNWTCPMMSEIAIEKSSSNEILHRSE